MRERESVCVCVCVCVRERVCVCVRERERDSEGESKRDVQTERERKLTSLSMPLIFSGSFAYKIHTNAKSGRRQIAGAYPNPSPPFLLQISYGHYHRNEKFYENGGCIKKGGIKGEKYCLVNFLLLEF
jgi:hypothetical protein